MKRSLLPLAAGMSLLAACALPPEPQTAAQPTRAAELFRIGRTNIYCVKAPCPWRGIARAGKDQRPLGPPFWIDADLPALKAAPDDAKRLRAAWDNSGCLVVEGRFEKDELIVQRIIDDC